MGGYGRDRREGEDGVFEGEFLLRPFYLTSLKQGLNLHRFELHFSFKSFAEQCYC